MDEIIKRYKDVRNNTKADSGSAAALVCASVVHDAVKILAGLSAPLVEILKVGIEEALAEKRKK